jgi:hypothetical protein
MEKNGDLMCIGCGFFMNNCGSHDAMCLSSHCP